MRRWYIFLFILIIAVFILLFAGCSNVEEPLDINDPSTDDGGGPTPPSQPKLTASDGEAEDLFGCSVSTDGYYAVVGAYQDDDKALDAGAAYVFHWNGQWWHERQKIVAKDNNILDSNGFGYSVSIKNGIIIIGACYDDERALNAGAAYIILWYGTEWMEQEKLLASDGQADEEFGFSVAADGDYAIVGSPHNSAVGTDSGASYIFHWNGKIWEEQQKLTPGSLGEQHGFSVSISGDYALVGAPYESVSRGSVYLYRRNGAIWQEISKLNASDRNPSDYFGWSVSIDGDYAIIGAPEDDDRGSNSGSAYIFHWNGSNWVQQQKLTPNDGEANDHFGHSVSIRGDTAVIGALYDDDNGPDSGSAYIYQWNGAVWEELEKIIAPDGEFDDFFGCSVSVSMNNVIVGAVGDNDNGVDAGTFYYF